MVYFTGSGAYITPKERMLKEIENAIEEKMGFVVTVEITGVPGEEYIINSPITLPYKKLYYENSYLDDLKLQKEPRVRITKFSAIEYKPENYGQGGSHDKD